MLNLSLRDVINRDTILNNNRPMHAGRERRYQINIVISTIGIGYEKLVSSHP